jgi:flagellar motor switch protein FliG
MSDTLQRDDRLKVRTMSGSTRAAVLLLLLGEEISAAIFKSLNEEEIKLVSQAISSLGTVGEETANAVMRESHRELTSGVPRLQGNMEYARKVIQSALTPDQAREIIRDLGREAGDGIKLLKKADPRQLSKLIQNEHPQTITLVVSHLDSSNGAATLALLPEATRYDVCMRLAKMEQISKPLQERVIGMIAEKLDEGSDASAGSSDGVRLVAEILNRMDRNVSRVCLEMVENENPGLALAIRNKMFVFDDILLISEKDVRTIIQRIDKQVLVRALKGTHEELREHFYRNMSQRAVDMLKEDMEAIGPIRLKDAEEAQQEVVNTIRQLEAEGQIDLGGEGGDQYVV